MTAVTHDHRFTSFPPYAESLWGAPTIPNYKAGKYVSERKEFVGSNFFGARVIIAGHDAYVVYSWRTPMLAWVNVRGTEWLWVNETENSSYSSRHRSYALGHGYYRSPRTHTQWQWDNRHAFNHHHRRGDQVFADLARRVGRYHNG